MEKEKRKEKEESGIKIKVPYSIHEEKDVFVISIKLDNWILEW